MKRLGFLFLSFLLLSVTAKMYAGNNGEKVENKVKEYFSDMNAKVKATDNPIEKRNILNHSLQKLNDGFTKLESIYKMNNNEKTFVNSFKNNLSEKYAELNGLNGYEKVKDNDLNKFADYVQQDMEVADQYVTISITALLLIAILVILLVR